MATSTIVNVGLGLLSAGAVSVSVTYFNQDTGLPMQTIVQTYQMPEPEQGDISTTIQFDGNNPSDTTSHIFPKAKQGNTQIANLLNVGVERGAIKLNLNNLPPPVTKAAPHFETPDKIREGGLDTVVLRLTPIGNQLKGVVLQGYNAKGAPKPILVQESIEMAPRMQAQLESSPPGMIGIRTLGSNEREVDGWKPAEVEWTWEISGLKASKTAKLVATVKGYDAKGTLLKEKEIGSPTIEVAKANWLGQWIAWGAAGLAVLLAGSLWMRIRSPKNQPEQPATKGKRSVVKLLDEARDHLRKSELELALELLEKSGKIPSVEMDTLHSQASRITKELRDGILTRENYNAQRQQMIRNLLQEIEAIKKGK